jgi:hypothetical protein
VNVSTYGGRDISQDRAAGSRSAVGTRPAGDYRPYSAARRPTQTYLQRAWRENPLLIGVAAAAAGAVVGLGVPETDRENELMGQTRDRMIDSVHGTVRDKVEKVQEAANTAMTSVQEAAKDAVGLGSSGSHTERDSVDRQSAG